MFDTTHILYMVISAVATVGLLVLASLLKNQNDKDRVLKFAAIITVIIHYSDIMVNYLNTGSATVENNHLFLIHPCNVMMWLLVIAAFHRTKQGLLYEMLSEFVFWVGVICGSIGIIFNVNYGNTPSLLDYDILKGLLSHSTMLFGCLYMRVGGYMQIKVFNVISCALGLLFFLLDGMIINALFNFFELPAVNSMYLQESPVPTMPWLSPMLMGLVGLTILFAILALYELRLSKEERWYSKLSVKLQDLKEEFRRK